MAGGTWTTPNKVRPGVYTHISSQEQPIGRVGERGIAALGLSLPWGEPQKMITVTPGTNLFEVLGYDISAPQLLAVKEVLKRAGTLLLYRLNSGTQATGTTAGLKVTARYGGERGNDIQIVIENAVDETGKFVVSTLLNGKVVNKQLVSSAQDLKPNLYVEFAPETGDLAATAGFSLTGGANGTVTNQEHVDFLAALEVQDFQTVGLLSSDATLKSLYTAFSKRLREQEGKKVQAVLSDYPVADYEGIISVKNGVILTDGTVIDKVKAVAWVTGATAAAAVNESLTYAAYDEAVDTDIRMSHTEIEAALTNGEFLFSYSGGKAVVEQDINSFTSIEPAKARHFSKNRVVRVLDGIANDLKLLFEKSYIGKVDNNVDGRTLFWAECAAYFTSLQHIGAIQNFNANEDIVVTPGSEGDVLFVDIKVQPVDAIEKVYMKVKVV
ncbi:phage tail sheath family protein [Paenibacillus sp. N3/727]|uniref:phage tail sheath family protein n=1 Tax=Paenibacillus sp. N3/727 TaxID=2925845 RepID=UPI001F53C8D6|nr:phage tail sheath family protein [Paenibacillus sp. N3/727]UNK17650.1 phage tail sheath family protein [Paenibacillus sp. N3/727]